MTMQTVHWVLIGIAAFSIAGHATGESGRETICINPKDDPPGADTTVACYSDRGCAYAESLGAEPIRDYDASSAPFALARGKISAIITDAGDVIKAARSNGASCMPIEK